MRLEDRVRLAFDLGINKDFLAMMAIALPAIDATAKKKYNRGGRSSFRNFLKENYDVFQWFSGGSLDFAIMRFPELKDSLTDGRKISNPDLADVLYYVYRCSLAHGQDISDACAIIPRGVEGDFNYRFDKDGNFINLPEPIAWAVLASIVLADVNSDIVTRSSHHFTLLFPPNLYFLNVDLFWGEKEKLSKIASRYEKPPDQTQEIMKLFSSSNA
jgi:hypothetical protein